MLKVVFDVVMVIVVGAMLRGAACDEELISVREYVFYVFFSDFKKT